MTSKRSECNSVQNQLGMRPPVSNFYREIESLNIDDEKRLV